MQAGQFIGSRGDFVPEGMCKQLCLLMDKVRMLQAIVAAPPPPVPCVTLCGGWGWGGACGACRCHPMCVTLCVGGVHLVHAGATHVQHPNAAGH